MKEPINCIIIHGCTDNEQETTYNKHWMPWLQKQLQAKNIPTSTPTFPEPWKPDYTKNKELFEKETIHEHTILIGHSCGAAFLVRWLGETKKIIKKLILVAPWTIPDPNNKEKETFYTYDIDTTIKERVHEIIMFTSDDEEEDGKKSIQLFHEQLGGKIIELKEHGHYTLEDMKTEAFPELLQEIIPLENKNLSLKELTEQLNLLKIAKEAAFQKKEKLKNELHAVIQEVKKIQTEQAKNSTGLKEARAERDQHREATKHLHEEIKTLKQEKETLLPPQADRINIHALKERIERLETSIETEGYDYTKEKKVTVEIKKLKAIYGHYKHVSDVSKEIRTRAIQLHEHGDKEHVYASIARALQGNKEQHQRFIYLINQLKKLRKEQTLAFKNFIEQRKYYYELLPLYKEKLEVFRTQQQNKRREQEQKEHQSQTTSKQKKKVLLEEKAKTVEEKWKQGKKLTTEDLIALQGTP